MQNAPNRGATSSKDAVGVKKETPSIRPAAVPVTRARSWLYSAKTLADSPSRVDGLSEAEERRERRSGCAHIQQTVKAVLEEPFRNMKAADPSKPTDTSLEGKMRFPAAAAMVLFNRFYSRHSFVRHDRFLIATACAFLGFKVEEQHQKIRYVLNASWDCYHGGLRARLDPSSAEFKSLRAAVLDMERIVMYTLEFDIAVEQPFPLIREYLLALKEDGVFASLGWPRSARNKEAPSDVMQANVQAINVAFECMATDLCLRFTPTEIAVAALEGVFHHVCSARGHVSPVTWHALRRVVTQLACGVASGGMPSSAGAGSSTPSAPATAQGYSTAAPLRALEESTVRDVLTRYAEYVHEACTDCAAIAGVQLVHVAGSAGVGEDVTMTTGHAVGASGPTGTSPFIPVNAL